MSFYYDNHMLKMDCSAGGHTISDIDIYIGNSILPNTPEYILKRNLGTKCLLVADKFTYSAAGEQLHAELCDAGFDTRLCLLDDNGVKVESDELSVGNVLLAMDPEPDFLVACGSGVINDVVRFVAYSTKKQFISIGTAASMDGYTSVIAPMIYHKKKVHRHGTAPKILVLDTGILKKAPYDMIVAGFGDVLGKYIAKADWLLSGIVNGEPVDQDAISMITQALDKMISNLQEIKDRTDKGLQAIIEGLILAGITIFTTGQTRAVASIEHNQGHIWETRMLEAGKDYVLHGLSVGCSTGYYLKMYDYLKSLDPDSLDKDAAKRGILDYEGIRSEAVKCFGEEFLAEIEPQNPVFRLSEKEFDRQFDALVNNWDRIIETLHFLPDWNQYRRIYSELGYTVFAEDLGIPTELIEYTLGYSNYYRNRFSVVDAMNVFGVSRKISAQVLDDYRSIHPK